MPRSRAASPLAGRGKAQALKDKRIVAPSGPTHSEFNETDDEGNATTKTASDDSDEWVPASSRPASTTAITQKAPLPHLLQPPSPIFENDVKAGRTQARRGIKMSVSGLANDLGGLDLNDEKTPRQSTRSTRQSTRMTAADEEDSITIVSNAKPSEGQKKKKR
jgi:hypothetical protein